MAKRIKANESGTDAWLQGLYQEADRQWHEEDKGPFKKWSKERFMTTIIYLQCAYELEARGWLASK